MVMALIDSVQIPHMEAPAFEKPQCVGWMATRLVNP